MFICYRFGLDWQSLLCLSHAQPRGQLFLEGDIRVINSIFLWAANCDSAKVIEKSVKFGAKCHETAPKL